MRVQLVRLAATVYGILLTVLLLVPDPGALLGLEEPPGPPGGRGVHFVAFLVFGLLMLGARWPIRRETVLLTLIVYAVVVESLQGFVPDRTVELLDYAENLVGLALGTCIGWLFQPRGNAGEQQ